MSELSQAAAAIAGAAASNQEPDAPEAANHQEPSPVAEVQPPETPSEGQSDSPSEVTDKPAIDPAIYDTEVPGLDGVTFGQLKDQHKELAQAEAVRAKAEADAIATQNENLQAREVLKTLAQNLGIQPTAEQIAEAQAVQERYRQEHEALAAERIDGWSDPVQRKADQQRSAKLLQEYLFSEVEAETAKDWRFQKLVRDYAHLRDRVSKALLSEVKSGNKGHQAESRRAPVSGKDQAKADFKAGKLSQTEAIAAILGGKQ